METTETFANKHLILSNLPILIISRDVAERRGLQNQDPILPIFTVTSINVEQEPDGHNSYYRVEGRTGDVSILFDNHGYLDLFTARHRAIDWHFDVIRNPHYEEEDEEDIRVIDEVPPMPLLDASYAPRQVHPLRRTENFANLHLESIREEPVILNQSFHRADSAALTVTILSLLFIHHKRND
ncbi:hypothetical protein GZ77_08405 [Endozoicomonas montiporae]|uniref:Uncharacterized protein n=1 Tax=Endozoicomonas montiporae TaxID=1027273 RepID=A0A081N7G8_9GAMM|nr:hypothetical protein [Endozoicomonas montiporae]KEQ14391.1 hypothetical protein GZ77_08405 [Endozoicomonas montiporae]